MEELFKRVETYINMQQQRMIIGISGHGAAGKSTFAKQLTEQLGEENVNLMTTDPYITPSLLRKITKLHYTYEGVDYMSKMTACHPEAHFVQALERDVKMIRDGKGFMTIDASYAPSKWIDPKKQVTIVEGMSVAFVDQSLFDTTIYFYTDADEEFKRRAVRDVTERGTDIDYLLHTHADRRRQYELYMHPYSEHAHIVVFNNEVIKFKE